MILGAVGLVFRPVVVKHARRDDADARQGLTLQNSYREFVAVDAGLKQARVAVLQRELDRIVQLVRSNTLDMPTLEPCPDGLIINGKPTCSAATDASSES